MSVNIGTMEFDAMGDLALVSPQEPWYFAGLGDFTVNDWDSIPDEPVFGDLGCGCGLGAGPDASKAPAAGGGHKKFPWGAVIGGAVGLAVGVGGVLIVRKLMKRR